MAVPNFPNVTPMSTGVKAVPSTPARSGRVRLALRCVSRSLGAAVLLACLIAAAVIVVVPGAATADDNCPDVEVIFARGTFEPPGIGTTGQGFADALRARLPAHSLNVHAVNYPASLDFPRAAEGVVDVVNRVRATAERCPATDVVLGGYSQGAAVAAYATSEGLPVAYAPP